MSLRRFLTVWIWLCVLPPLALSAILAAWHVDDVRRDHVEQAQRLAASTAGALDHHLRARLAALEILARSPLADDPSRPEGLYRAAQAYRETFDSHVALASPDGRMLFNTLVPLHEALPPMPRPEGRSALQLALSTTAPAVGDLFAAPLAGEPLVAMAVPGLRDGRVRFVLLSVAGTRHLARHLGEQPLPPQAALTLRDSLGAAVAHVGAAEPPGGAIYTARLQQAPWTVELRVARADHLEPLIEASVIMAAALLAAMAAGVLGGRWAGRRLARDVRNLARDPGATAATAITEIDEARHALRQAAEARDAAERARRDSDATYRRKLEQTTLALQTSEAMLRGVFESASEAMITVNAAQFIVMANPAAAQMFRCPVHELVGRPLASLLPERHRPAHAERVRRFGDGDDGARRMQGSREVTGLRADGEEFPAEVGISHVHVDGRELFTAILRDVGERRRADADLRTSKARLEAALASMNDAVFIADAEGRLVQFNEAFVGFHRFARREECPSGMAEFPALFELTWADGTPAPPAEWAVPRALRGETASLVEYGLRRRDTGERWSGSFSFAPIRDRDGSVAGAVVTARDITELRRQQSELRASHETLRRFVAARDGVQEDERRRIARELHDDLQQTLAAIMMEVATLRQQRGDDEPVAQALARIGHLATAGIVSTRRIVNDLRPQLLEELGLAAALEALAAQFMRASGVDCELEAELDAIDERKLPATLATCLYRVAQEALNNVAKHADARHVRIHVGLASPGSGQLVLRIRDDGRGLAPGAMAKAGSFGVLGMAERVRAVAGTLRIGSAPEGGTEVEVEVSLPAADDDGAPPA